MHVLNHPETQDSLFISWQENQDNQPILDLVGSHDHLQATFASSPPPTSPPLPISSSTPLHAPSFFAESAPPPPPSSGDKGHQHHQPPNEDSKSVIDQVSY